MTAPLRLLLAGYGTVGQALHELIRDAGLSQELPVVGVVRSDGAWTDPKGLAPGEPQGEAPRDLDVLEALDAVDADVLVELTPSDLDTGEPGLTHIRTALEHGHHVVTANKGPLVVDYAGLTGLARDRDLAMRFEAAAGASLPIMNLREFCLRGNPVHRLEGILNGTCNYILTRMTEEGLPYGTVLSEAQALGFAEADPSLDVGGWDAAAKAVILANHVLDVDLALEDVEVSGIQALTPSAVQLARKRGYAVRLIAQASRDGTASVAPRLVPEGSPLNVAGTLNVVRLVTEHAGPLALTGRGAGGRETASAVLSDLLAVQERYR